jgi:glycosyltransferase involved in cell wall biosynthesis
MEQAVMDLSVVLPVFNEVDNIPLVAREVIAAVDGLKLVTEIVFVDDGSTDGSTEAIRALMVHEPRLRLLRLEKNAGLTAAFDAGYAASTGRIVVTLDADLQNDPKDMAALLTALDGADAALGWRRERHDSWKKRLSSRVANAIRKRVTGDDALDSGCSLRALRRECLSALVPYDGMHRFVPTLLRQAGFRVVQVPVHHRARRFGRSKFGLRNRALRAFIDLLAVQWLGRRALRYRVREIEPPTSAPPHDQ